MEPKEGSFQPLVICLHGIRTHGEWQRNLAPILTQAGFLPGLISYGYFPATLFLMPWQREKKVTWLNEELERLKGQLGRNGEIPSVIAHSFGTYLVAKLMEKYGIKFDKVIFVGSIVRPEFSWKNLLREGKFARVLNQYGGMDFWAWIVQYFVPDTGPSGYKGFYDEAGGIVVQQGRAEFKHGDYFYNANIRENWMPFLKGEKVAERQQEFTQRSYFSTIMATMIFTAIMIYSILWMTKAFSFQKRPEFAELSKRLDEMEARFQYMTKEKISFQNDLLDTKKILENTINSQKEIANRHEIIITNLFALADVNPNIVDDAVMLTKEYARKKEQREISTEQAAMRIARELGFRLGKIDEDGRLTLMGPSANFRLAQAIQADEAVRKYINRISENIKQSLK